MTRSCTRCGCAYEAGSTEQANEPGRLCSQCWLWREAGRLAAAAQRRAYTVELTPKAPGEYDICAEPIAHTEARKAANLPTRGPIRFARQNDGEGGWTIDVRLLGRISREIDAANDYLQAGVGMEEIEAVLLAVEKTGCGVPTVTIDLGAQEEKEVTP